jgi:glycosyltransferase involved in cell wall biosynthesis
VNKTMPQVSLVICTRNRLSSLRRSLEAALATETDRHWELVVVDNGSADGTRKYLTDLQASLTGQILVLDEPHRGLSRARNVGWKGASSSLIAFTDDDCYIAPDYIDSVAAAFERDPTVDAMGGQVLLYDPTDLPITITDRSHREEFRPCAFLPAGSLMGANMAFRRAALQAIGGFDEILGAGTPFPSEDIDAFAALLWVDKRVLYEPSLTVYHHHGRKTQRDADELNRGYDSGRGAYYAKYLLRRKSMQPYFRAWVRSCGSEVLRYRTLRRTWRELQSALQYVAVARVVQRDDSVVR